MAFNPFHRFRKHQKAFFAVLTIICMITFVFQFGAGDVFTRALSWFGAVGNKGAYVATLYGDKVYQRDLDRLQRQRRTVNEFLVGQTGAWVPMGQYQAVRNLSDQVSQARADAPPPLPLGVRLIPQSFLFRTDPNRPSQPLPQRFRTALGDLRSIREEALAVQRNPDQLKILDSLAAAIAFEAWTVNPQRPKDELFFGGTAYKTEDQLDFLIWKHQADRLGIVLTEADVIREVNRAAGNFPVLAEGPWDRNPVVARFVAPRSDRDRRAAPITSKELLEALTDEFRVQLAREALMGEGSGVRFFRNLAEPVRLSPTAATPDDFLEFYRDARTTLKVAFLPLKVANFVDQVQGEPSEQDLLNRYETYKNEIAKPDERTPGFKEPQRIVVQSVSVSTESPFYQKKAKEMAKALSIYSDPALSAALRVAAGFQIHNSGGFPATAWLARLPHEFDPLRNEYETYRTEEQSRADRDLGVGFDLRDRSPVKDRPLVTASVIAQALGAGATGLATPLAVASIPSGVEAIHQKATARAFGSAVLAGGSLSPLAALTLPIPFTHSALPRDAVQPLLVERFEKDVGRALLHENLLNFKTELAKLKGKPAEAQKYVAKAVADFGFQDLRTSKLDSRYEVPDDPALKPLKDAWDEFRKDPTARMMGADYPPFADLLFQSSGLDQVIWFPVYQWDPLPRTGKPTWVFWRTEEKPTRVLSFDEVRSEVAYSWRFDKARQLAREEAARLHGELKKTRPTAEEAVKFLQGQKHGFDEFTLENIARLVPRSSDFLPGRLDFLVEYRPYEVPADKIAYPPADFVDKLLKLKEPGDSLVLADRPMKTYYVAVLVARSSPHLREFKDAYSLGARSDPIWQRMMDDRRQTFQEELMKQLRLEAVGSKDQLDEQGNIKVPENLRVRGESSAESE
jgi:hypothetical protein